MADPQLEKYLRIAKKLKNPTPVELPSGKFRCQVTVQGERISIVDEDPRTARAEALAIKASLKEAPVPQKKKTLSAAIDDYIESKSNTLSPSTMKIGGWADSKTMHDIYTHISEKDIATQSGEFENFFSSAGGAAANKEIEEKDAEIEALKKQVADLQKKLDTLSLLQEQLSQFLQKLDG